MLSKNRISLIKSLKMGKYRSKEGLFVAEGKKCIQELLDSDFQLHSIYALESSVQVKGNQRDKVHIATINELSKISFISSPSDALALFEIPKYVYESDDVSNRFSIALDGVRDPGNMGTIIRIADWFGIQNIFCSTDCVDIFNPKCIMSTMGSISRVKVHQVNLSDLLSSFKEKEGFDIYAADMDGADLRSQKLSKAGILVMGNESNGISKNLLPLVTQNLGIKGLDREGATGAESLNVAIATSIICYEFSRL